MPDRLFVKPEKRFRAEAAVSRFMPLPAVKMLPGLEAAIEKALSFLQ